jgi:hypothetical protein
MSPEPNSSFPGTKGEWSLADLIDLEVLVREDAETERAQPDLLVARDAVLRRQIAGDTGISPASRRRGVLRKWLAVRRRERFQDHPSPGEEVVSVMRWLSFGLALAGLAVARGAVWSFFRGAETEAFHPEPINVLWYGLVCIGLPFLFSLYGFWVWLGYKALPRLPHGPAFLRGAVWGLVKPLVRRATEQISESLGAERRLHVQSVLGALRQRLESRRSAIAATFFHLVQAFGVAFTIGVLVFSWIDCKFYSRVFGWQTTDAETTPETVHGLVRGIATPWTWLRPEGFGFPNLEQVEKTNFVRFHSPADFPKDASSAWAAFLIWAALVYGVLPRLLLERLSAMHVRSALRREDFTELRFDPLWERLTTPEERAQIQAPAPDAPVYIPPRPAQGFSDPSPTVYITYPETRSRDGVSAVAAPAAAVTRYAMVLPSDIREPGCAEAVAEWMRQKKGWEQGEVKPLGYGIGDREKLIGELAGSGGDARDPHLLFVQESFMPPVEEYLELLRKVRAAVGPKRKILVGLLGKPNRTPLARPPSPVEVEVWEGVVAKLGDPNLGVFSFLTPAQP